MGRGGKNNLVFNILGYGRCPDDDAPNATGPAVFEKLGWFNLQISAKYL